MTADEFRLVMDGAADRERSDDDVCVTAWTDLRDFLIRAGADELDSETVDQIDARVTDRGELILAIWGEPR